MKEDAVYEGPVIQRRALEHLSEVLGFISPERKAAYLQALRDCPELVQTESNPLTFLRFEKYNSWSASKRLVTYWSKRKEIFGERAFLPMDLSGNGALSEEVANYIASGSELLMITTGNILVCDVTLANDTIAEITRLRMRFFFLQKMIEPCMQAGEGPRVFVRGFSINLARTRVNRETRLLFEQAFPVPQVEDIHLTYIKEKNPTLWQYIIPHGLQQVAGVVSRFKVHNCDSVEDLAESLSRHSISRSSLPLSFGGHYNQDANFVQFLLDNGYPAEKLGQNLLYGPPHDVDGNLDTLVDYFISKAPTLPDIHDMEPLGLSKYLRTCLTLSSSNPSPQFHQSSQPATIDERATAHGSPSPTNSNASSQAPSRSVVLALPSDKDYLSEYQCMLRENVEYFAATYEDIIPAARGRKSAIALGQVGIRCRHCAHLPREQRRKGAACYPTKFDRLFQTSVNLCRIHLMDSCQHVPMTYRQRTLELYAAEPATGLEYWQDAAQISGVVEAEKMLRFRKEK